MYIIIKVRDKFTNLQIFQSRQHRDGAVGDRLLGDVQRLQVGQVGQVFQAVIRHGRHVWSVAPNRQAGELRTLVTENLDILKWRKC